MPLPESDSAAAQHSSTPSPAVVAIAGWLLPGAGYWLIGHRARALVAGVAIIILFMSGILIGGVRSIQVPGYGEDGGALYIIEVTIKSGERGEKKQTVIRVAEQKPGTAPPSNVMVATDVRALMGDVANKPWSICQVLAGPLAIGSGAWSVQASRPVAHAGADVAPRGVLSHSRVNEIAVLYTAVAGMLNLIVIIDAAARASHAQRERGVVARGDVMMSCVATLVAFTPFMQPLPVWEQWPWLLVPLCFGVSLVYKSVRVESVRRVPIEAAKGAFWIVVGMIAAAIALVMLLRFLAD